MKWIYPQEKRTIRKEIGKIESDDKDDLETETESRKQNSTFCLLIIVTIKFDSYLVICPA